MGYSGGGRWDGWQEARSDLLRKTQNRGRHRWEGYSGLWEKGDFFGFLDKKNRANSESRVGLAGGEATCRLEP